MAYSRFFLMIAVSTVLMFGLMYLNTYLIGHVFWSETRAYMAIVMGALMAFVMLAFMWGMYQNRAVNIAIFAGAIVVFAGALWLVRSQVTVQDRSYMRAMIPHHSIAIMTSSRAEITDPRVRVLADDIIYAQDKEIAEMRYLVADISANGDAAPKADAPASRLKSAQEALATEVVAKVDPEFLKDEDIAQVFPAGAECRFTYTQTSPPVLVSGNGAALVKISGDLVRLEADADRFAANPVTVEVRQTDDSDLRDLIIRAGPDYEAGFRGQYRCAN
ncbi:hypothetical protein ATI53_10797 [Salipiger aestuarii]|uniref:DUF305 domain-containing protein n=1 Tax=Salipiger aestuarii TaxID=568098 RepID=A0A327XK86_9RHOB|nr:DUF305 domain-containing protein [Salipiger aestuarii]EIE51562.1 hypothetical protein C357_07881 [Citreicella sp. 357]RAK08541.1 hypothetical protein ATI53_10797 [Salipiger aestuarii]